MERIEAEVSAHKLVVIFRFCAVVSEQTDLLGQRLVIRHNHSAVACRTQVLAWEKAEAANSADTSCAAALVGCRNRLRGVFDHKNTVPCGNLHDWIHVAHLAVQVYGQDSLCPAGDPRLNLVRVDVIGGWIDVDEYGRGTSPGDGSCGGKEGEGCRNHLVACADSKGHQAAEQRICAARYSDPISTSAERGNPPLEFGQLWATDADLRVQDIGDRLHNVVLDGCVLRFQVEKRNFHHKAPCKAGWALNSSYVFEPVLSSF